MATNNKSLVPNLKAPSLSVPRLWVPGLEVPQLDAPGKSAKRAKRDIRYAKDLGDIILGHPLTGTKQLQNTLREYHFDYLKYVPLVNRIVGAGLMIHQRALKPLSEGDLQTVTVNALESAASSFDVLSNPVKALLPWAGGGSSTDLLKSMGWVEGEYREYYQWNTGNWAVDVVGEFFSDPLNWVSLGQAAIGKAVLSTTDDIVEQATKIIARNSSKEAAEIITESAYKNFARELIESSADESSKVISNFIDTLKASAKSLQDDLANMPHTEAYFKLQQTLNAWPHSPQQLQAIAKELNQLRNSKLYQAYDLIRKAAKHSDNVQNAINIAAGVLNPVGGLSQLTITKLAVPTFKAAFNKFVRTLSDVMPRGMTQENFKYVQDVIKKNNGTIHKPIYSVFQEVFAEYHLSEEDLMELYVKVYNNTPRSIRNTNMFDEIFKEELFKHMPRLKHLVAAEDFAKNIDPLVAAANKAAVDKGLIITAQQVDELVEALSNGGRILIQLNDIASADRLNRALLEIEEFWAKNADGVPEGLSRIEMAIDNIRKVYPDFELENLVEFLNQIQSKDMDSFLRYCYLFNYIGITKDNVKQVAEIIKAAGNKELTADAAKQLEDILSRGKTGYYITRKAIVQNRKYVNALAKRITKDYKIKIFDDKDLTDKIYRNIDERAQRNAIQEIHKHAMHINMTKQDLLKLKAKVTNFIKELPGRGTIEFMGLGPLYSMIPDADEETKLLFNHINKLAVNLGFNRNADLFNIEKLNTLIDSYETLKNLPNIEQFFSKLLEYAEPFKKYSPGHYNYILNLPRLWATIDEDVAVVVANVKDLIKQSEDLFIYTSVEHGDLLITTAHLAQSEMDPDVWMQLSMPDSELRKNLHIATSQLRAGIVPDVGYELVPNLQRADGQPVLALVDANGNIRIKDKITKKEFFDYINGKGPRSTTSRQKQVVMQRLRQALVDEESTVTWADELYDAIKTEEDIRYFLFMHEYSHRMHGDAAKYTKNLLSESNLEIEARATIDAIKAVKAQKQRLNLAYFIDTMLATVDGTNNINRILGNLPILNIGADKKMRDYLQGLIYNIIYEYRDMPADSFLNPTMFDSVVDRFVKQAVQDNKAYFNAQPELVERLRSNFSEALKEYVNTQVLIGQNTSTNIKLLQTWTYGWFNDTFGTRQNAARIFDTIGLSYKPVMESLMLAKVNPQVIVDTAKSIKFISNNVAMSEIAETNRKITAYALSHTDDAEFVRYVDEQLQRTYEVTLSDAIDEAEKEIASINKRLTRSQSIDDKFWGVEGEEQAKNALAIMLASETDEFTKHMGRYQNRYNSSTSNQYLGFKKVISQDFIKENHLEIDTFGNITNKGYMLLYNKMQSVSNIIRDMPFTDQEELNVIKNGLISLFMDNPTLEFAPNDPIAYFNSLNAKQLKAWDMAVSDSNLGVYQAGNYKKLKYDFTENRRYTYSQKVQYRTTPESMYQTLDECATRHGVSETTQVYKQECTKLDVNEKYGARGVHDVVTRNFGSYIRTPEDLGKYRLDVNNFIQQDLHLYNKLRDLDELVETGVSVRKALAIEWDEMPEHLRAGLKEEDWIEDRLAILESWGIESTMNTSSGQVRMFYTHERNVAMNESFNQWSALELRDFIDRNNDELGFVIYKQPEYMDATLPNLAERFTEQELKDAGLIIVPMENTGYYFIRRVDNNTLSAKQIHGWTKPNYIFRHNQQVINRTIEGVMPSLRYDKCTIPIELYVGTSITMDDLKLILQNEEIVKLMGDVELQKTYGKFDKNGVNLIFENKKPIPNTIFIGDVDTYNDFYYKTDMIAPEQKVTPMPTTNVLDRELWATATQSIDADNTDNKLMQVFFNNDFAADNPMFNEVFRDASDAEIKEVFKRNNWKAVVLKKSPTGKPKVYEYFVTNRRTLEQAKKLGAIIVPYESYRLLVLGINKKTLTNKAIRTYLAMCSLYKSIYLTTPGFLLRNEWDSNFIKNLSSTKGMTAFFDNVNYRYKAAKLNEWYEKMQCRIKEISIEEMGPEFKGTINKRFTQMMMEELSDEDKQLYIMLDMFNRSPGSAGLSKVMEEILYEYNEAHGAISKTAMEEWLNRTVYSSSWSPIKWVNSVNDHIERDARLSLYLNLVDHGLRPTDAIRKIIDTHFDYTLSAYQLKPAEQIIWFSVFPFNNVAYYLTGGLTDNVDVLKFQFDMLEQSWNNDDITWEDVKKNDYYYYNVMAGNMRFKVGDKNIVLKLGSSVMDFFNLMTNPVDSLKSRVNPFLATALGLEPVSELNPFSSNIYRAKQIYDGKSLVPSVYTTMKDYHYRPKRKYIDTQHTNVRTWRRYPKRNSTYVPSSAARRRYRVSSSRYYFNNAQKLIKWLSSTTPVAPFYYNKNRRYTRLTKTYLKNARVPYRIR